MQMDLASLEALRDELRKLPSPERTFWPTAPAGAPTAAAV
jgi:hypothetical protein